MGTKTQGSPGALHISVLKKIATREVAGREHRQQLLKLVDNSVDLMSILNMNGTNSYINAAGREILGIDADADVTIIPISDFHTPEQLAFVEAEIIPNVMSKGSWSGQFAIRHCRTGEIIPLFNNCHRIDDIVTGEPIGIGAMMRDMRPELNARLELEEKVTERTAKLQAANEELGVKNAELASFAYISSHDLQEPLRKIRTFTDRILATERDALSLNGQEDFSRIDKAAIRMQALIEDLLAYSRTGTGKNIVGTLDLTVILDDVKANLHDEILQKQAVIKVHALCEARIIPFQFRQLLSNLVDNALKFSRPDVAPYIEINAEIIDAEKVPVPDAIPGNLYCHLRVSDNGIGFDQKYSNKIFEVFQRLHGRHEYDGAGIGLAIVKKIVGNHNGIIRASGEPDNGACFDIYLPQ